MALGDAPHYGMPASGQRSKPLSASNARLCCWLPSSPDQRAYQNFPRVQARALQCASVLRRCLFPSACSPSRSGPQQPIDSANGFRFFALGEGGTEGLGSPLIISLERACPAWRPAGMSWFGANSQLAPGFPARRRLPPQQRGCAASSCRIASSLLTNSSASTAEKTSGGRSLMTL